MIHLTIPTQEDMVLAIAKNFILQSIEAWKYLPPKTQIKLLIFSQKLKALNKQWNDFLVYKYFFISI